jgi:import inner membrane translocase subunit TIM54
MVDSQKPIEAGASSSASTANGGPTIGKTAAPRQVPTYLQPLRYMGIPKAVLTWLPRLPSRNWSIFWALSISITSLYVYDRRECKRIRKEYVEQLEHLAKQPLLPREYARKLQVYTAKSPGDEDPEKSLLFFKLYVKPFLVAAGIDWVNLNGMRHGGLARELRERHYSRRRQLLGLEPWGMPPSTSANADLDPFMAGMVPFALTPQEQLQHELDGGIIIVGRAAYKEWAWGLREGWTTRLPPQRQDLEEQFAQTLLDDGVFDEEEDLHETNAVALTNGDQGEDDGAGAPLPSRLGPTNNNPISFNPAFQKLGNQKHAGTSAGQKQNDGPQVDAALLEPSNEIPAQAPITYVDFVNLTGFKHVPRKIVGFFRHRDRFELGGQAALNVALGSKADAREFEVLVSEDTQLPPSDPPQGGDLDWGLNSEKFYHKRFLKLLSDMDKERTTYYKDLKQRLKDTRSYVRGERELSATEKNDPPKNESDLRAERFRRERDWALSKNGYEILRPEAGLAWHPSFAGRLRVFRDQEKRAPIAKKDEEDFGAA